MIEKYSPLVSRVSLDLSPESNCYDFSLFLKSVHSNELLDVIPSKNEILLCYKQERDMLSKEFLQNAYHLFTKGVLASKNPDTLNLKATIKSTEDLKLILNSNQLSLDDFINQLITASFKLDMFGFIPGFMYLDGLPKELHMPRKSSPAYNCPANSLAIGGQYLGVYKYPSPAGWFIIGQILNLPSLEKLHTLNRGTKIVFEFIYEA